MYRHLKVTLLLLVQKAKATKAEHSAAALALQLASTVALYRSGSPRDPLVRQKVATVIIHSLHTHPVF